MEMLNDIVTWLNQQFMHNDVFAGIMGGSLLMSSLFVLRGVPEHLWRLFLHQATCHVVVYNDDDAFAWLEEWLSRQSYADRSRRLKLSTFSLSRTPGQDEKWSLSPGPGSHVFWYGSGPVLLERKVDEGPSGGTTLRRREQMDIRVLGRGQKQVRALIEDARKLREDRSRVDVYVYGDYWQRVSSRLPRDPESLVLPREQMDRVLGDAHWFLGASPWYAEHGVPYRRGYLLSGPPGCGKTSLVLVMASVLKRPIYMLNLGSVRSDDDLMDAMAGAPENSIVLIEDVDSIGVTHRRDRRGKSKGDPGEDGEDDRRKFTPLTMSGVLNTLDGIASKDGRLLVMTTNYPDRLDAALVRPGRVDMHEVISPLGPEHAARLFLRFFPGAHEAAETLETSMMRAVSAAELQSVFLTTGQSPDLAVNQVLKITNGQEPCEKGQKKARAQAG